MTDDRNESKLSKEQKQMVIDMAKNMAGSLLIQGVMSGVHQLITKLTTTNHKKSTITGTKEVAPTKDETILDKKESTANKNEASLAKDDVRAQQGTVQAADTEAQAAKTDARAADSGASAMMNKAGALDVAAKGMKIN